MKIARWFVLSMVSVLGGCGEILFGSADDYDLGSSSCRELAEACGPHKDESCCVSRVVEGSTAANAGSPLQGISVSTFRLDRFEVTVGRFRSFVQAYPRSKPAAGHGAHPRIPSSGWNAAWDSMLPVAQWALEKQLRCNPTFGTWAKGIETLPINCVDWYVAFAFCAWDGGRLPTEAEWHSAAAGGSENRGFPWSNPPSLKLIDPTHASYDCRADGSARWSCSFADILAVGTKSPTGDGRFGLTDMAGNMREWMLDTYHDVPTTACADCAYLPTEGGPKVLRGGAWDLAADTLRNAARERASPGFRFHDIGFRCARD